MEIVFDRCAGMDVQKRTVVVSRLTRDDAGVRVSQIQTFGTTTSERLRLADWLTEGGCSHVGLERTGEYWKPVFTLLEGGFEMLAAQCGAHQSGYNRLPTMEARWSRQPWSR
jgi:transposase